MSFLIDTLSWPAVARFASYAHCCPSCMYCFFDTSWGHWILWTFCSRPPHPITTNSSTAIIHHFFISSPFIGSICYTAMPVFRSPYAHHVTEPRTQVGINKMPKRTAIDFFVAMIVSSFSFDDSDDFYKKGQLSRGRKKRPQRETLDPLGAFILDHPGKSNS